jgi:hypothetical protein
MSGQKKPGARALSVHLDPPTPPRSPHRPLKNLHRAARQLRKKDKKKKEMFDKTKIAQNGFDPLSSGL